MKKTFINLVFLALLFLSGQFAHSQTTFPKFFALGDSIAQEYETQVGGGGPYANGHIINDATGYNQVGASPTTIANFASALSTEQINYIKTNGIIIFSGTNNPSQILAVETTVKYLVRERGINPNQIYLSNILNTVPGSSTFNSTIAVFASQDVEGQGKIHLVDIQNLHSSDGVHPVLS